MRSGFGSREKGAPATVDCAPLLGHDLLETKKEKTSKKGIKKKKTNITRKQKQKGIKKEKKKTKKRERK